MERVTLLQGELGRIENLLIPPNSAVPCSVVLITILANASSRSGNQTLILYTDNMSASLSIDEELKNKYLEAEAAQTHTSRWRDPALPPSPSLRTMFRNRASRACLGFLQLNKTMPWPTFCPTPLNLKILHIRYAFEKVELT
jgi:hypothetical protein